ncbi:MAG: DNA polymerase IV [Acidobacteria bacterium]|nr:DNA polymerase IV [Acidobacteriota bacterium]
MATARTIFHLDMDAFFVSVEELFDPSLKGKPVVVGGRPNQRGVVSAASYAARKFGVHSAMPLRTAYQLCPHAIFVDGHPDRYRELSGRVREVLDSFSPSVSMASIDEAYLDVTGTERLYGPPLAAAQKLHERIKERTQLNCSIGIAASRLVAKVSSDQAKPNGVLWVMPGLEAQFLAPLEVRRIPGVGKVMEKNLHAMGIRKVGDLVALDVKFLEEKFGKWGLALAGKSIGADAGGWFDSEVGASEDPKSISHEHTYGEDTKDRNQLDASIAQLTEMVARRLREHGLWTRTVQLKLRYTDFSTFTRAHTLDHATQMDTDILAQIRALFARHWTGKPIRLLGVQAGNLTRDEGQLSLLGQEKSDRWRRALGAADAMRDRYGDGSVGLAASLKGKFRERVHEATPVRRNSKKPD